MRDMKTNDVGYGSEVYELSEVLPSAVEIKSPFASARRKPRKSILRPWMVYLLGTLTYLYFTFHCLFRMGEYWFSD